MRYQSYNNRRNYIWLILLLFFLFGGLRFFFVLLGIVFAFFPILLFAILATLILNRIMKTQPIESYLHKQPREHNQFVELVARLCAHMINADGNVEKVELQTFKNFFAIHMGYRAAALMWVEDLLMRELKHQHSLTELAHEMNRFVREDVKLVFLDLLYQIAHADFELHVAEDAVLREIARLLHISTSEEEIIRHRYAGGQPMTQQEGDYQTLGILPGATQEEIKSAYRTLVKKFHPDVVSHLGSEFSSLSEEKMKAITAAYSRLYKAG